MEIFNDSAITERLGVTKPVLLIDEAIWETTLKTKCMLDKELFFWKHHFLNNPVMPGTYMLEMLAQSAAFFDMLISKKKRVPIIVSMSNVRFLREVKPGQLLESEIKVKRIDGQYYTTLGKAVCEGKTVCKAEMVHYVKE